MGTWIRVVRATSVAHSGESAATAAFAAQSQIAAALMHLVSRALAGVGHRSCPHDAGPRAHLSPATIEQ